MKWETRRSSSNVEDRRRTGRGPIIGGGIGISTIVIALIIFLMGGNPTEILNNQITDNGTGTSYSVSQEEEELAQFVSVVSSICCRIRGVRT